MKRTKLLAVAAILGVSVCLGMTLIHVPSNPLPKGTKLEMPAEIEGTLRRACFDCHSNETRWPWYSKVWPVSSMIESDVAGGRAVMNFSEWPSRSGQAVGLLMASCAAMQQGEMPLPKYLMLHHDARLSAEEKHKYCDWTAHESAAIRHQPKP